MMHTIPVLVDGTIQLYDIYIDGQWIGSRRTLKQCEEAAKAYRR